jgi:hypothetical protein
LSSKRTRYSIISKSSGIIIIIPFPACQDGFIGRVRVIKVTDLEKQVKLEAADIFWILDCGLRISDFRSARTFRPREILLFIYKRLWRL